MTLLQTILRFPLAPEVLALLEKIDSIGSVYDASYQPIERLIEDAGFSRYERRMLKKALSKISRRHAYSCAMHVVIKNELPEAPRKSAALTRDQVVPQFTQVLRQEFDKAYAAQQASTLTNGGIASLTSPYDKYRNAQQ
jgi:endonuclease III